MDYMFDIVNCNNIKEAHIVIKKNFLNIKYGMNGTGKSTISRAIELYSMGTNVDEELHSFGIEQEAQVTANQDVNAVLLFNEEFVEHIVFKENKVIENSFDIFVKSPDYDTRVERLNQRLNNLKTNIIENQSVTELHDIFNNVSEKLKRNSDESLKRDAFYKSIVTDKNLFNIPTELNKFSVFIRENPNNIEWIDWKNKGHKYDEIAGCPFCACDLADEYSTEKQIFETTFKKSTSNNLKVMLQFIESLKKYMNIERYKFLLSCIKEIEDIETIDFALNSFANELYYLRNKIQNIKVFDSFTVKRQDIGRLNEILDELFINKDFLTIFDNEIINGFIDSINEKIKQIKNEVDSLKAEVGAIRGYIEAVIRNHKKDINYFLKSAGMKYEVDIIVNGEQDAITTLHYLGEGGNRSQVDKIKKHLSWGEKNAFALILFMFYSISQSPDIVILDDPISSFDRNKKYAIINRLFTNSNLQSLYNKTVIMLTHDFEPIIDFVVNTKPTGGNTDASFIRNDNGIIIEKPIANDRRVESYIKMLIRYSKDDALNAISRLVFLRQYIEHTNSNSDDHIAYNIISCIIHGKSIVEIKQNDGSFLEATADEIQAGTNYIREFIKDFNYNTYHTNFFNCSYIEQLYNNLSNSYQKIQLFRTYIDIADCRTRLRDDVLLKFIDEIYHIENDYIYYLDLFEYDIVPSYIAKKCDDFFEKIIDI